MVYTEENIKAAKNDRAELNKLIKEMRKNRIMKNEMQDQLTANIKKRGQLESLPLFVLVDEYEEEKKIIEYDKDGNVKPVKIEKTKKHVPPDVTAQIFWLKNRQRDRWQDRPQDYVDQTSDNDAEVQIYLPDNGRDD